MADGLEASARQQIHQVLAQCGHLDEALLYGSRALGTYHAGSDVDLALRGSALTLQDVARLMGQLDDLPLPYRYDLTLWSTISNLALRQHIITHGVMFWRRSETMLPPL